MAQRRMFSQKIVGSDAFVEMPVSARELYFQLGMYADDDGFINPKKIIRMIGASDDDLKILLAKRFLLPFENGVVVIKHWIINNLIRKDFYQETIYIDQKKQLKLKENKSYTEDCKQIVNNLDTQDRIGKDRIGKDINTSEQGSQEVKTRKDQEVLDVIDSFKCVNPSYKKYFGNKTQRAAAERLVKEHGLEKVLATIANLPELNARHYYPKSTTPLELENNLGKLLANLKADETKKGKIIDLNV